MNPVEPASPSVRVPFLDLKPYTRAHREEFEQAMGAVMDEVAFAGGRFVEQFEAEFAGWCGSRYAIGVGNGTDALWMALLAAGVGPGDEVITVPATFMATTEAILLCGAIPVFVDIDPETYAMNPALLPAALTPKTKAILPVHLFGHPADMEAILKIAHARGIPVIEDAAQAHGARCQGRAAGTMGLAGCFSFYPGKNLGAFGEAGAIVTNDPAMANQLRQFRDHGQSVKYSHTRMGWNCRMDGLQAAILSINLRHLEARNDLRRVRAERYQELLQEGPGITLPRCASGNEHCYHIYAVLVQDRDTVMQEMAARGIACGIHYPIPVHLQEACAPLGHRKGSFPIAEACAEQFLSLPMYPEMPLHHLELTASALLEVTRRGQSPAVSAPALAEVS